MIDEAKQKISDLQALKQSRGWKIIEEIQQANIEQLKNIILNSRNDVKIQTKEQLIRWLDYLQELSDLPDKIITSLGEGKTAPVDFDPYHATYEEIMRHEEQDTTSE